MEEENQYLSFPVKITRRERREPGPIFESHWHEQFQIFYFERGEAVIRCNSQAYEVKAGNLMIVNGNEIHYGESHCQHLTYYLIKVDLHFLFSGQADICQIKYINPLLQGRIRFLNHIGKNDMLIGEFLSIVQEYNQQEHGWELAVKGRIFSLLALLLRRYQQDNSLAEGQDRQRETLQRLRTVLEYMDRRYSEDIPLSRLASLANMSSQHFCRVFKNLTGKRPVDYMNRLRINESVALLAQKDLNISEIARAVGFADSNYFSRLFKKYQRTSPSAMQKSGYGRLTYPVEGRV